jgi:hypothetical protein
LSTNPGNFSFARLVALRELPHLTRLQVEEFQVPNELTSSTASSLSLTHLTRVELSVLQFRIRHAIHIPYELSLLWMSLRFYNMSIERMLF